MRIDLSVIIVNYRSWTKLDDCLQSLHGIELSGGMEVIVVDNCSGDDKLPGFAKKFPWVVFYSNKGNFGFSSGCNFGANKAKGEYLLFLNPDIVANQEAIAGMLQLLRQNPTISLLSCRQKNSDGKEEKLQNLFPSLLTLNGIPRAIYRFVHRAELSERFKREKAVVYPDWVSGSVMLISRTDFEKTGGWCEDYWLYYEDVELCWQVRKHAGLVALSNEHSMIHNHGGATRINPATASLTKAEVRISKHVFVSRHYIGIKAFTMHLFSIIGGLVGKLLPALLSIPFFFNRKLRAYGRLYIRLLQYYLDALKNGKWISPRAVNFKK